MKLTDTQINQIFAPAEKRRRAAQLNIDNNVMTGHGVVNDLPARRVMVESIIEGYQTLEPAPSVRWIPAANRKPTEEDFKGHGYVMILRSDGSVVACHSASHELDNQRSHWMSVETIKSLPKEPVNAEAVEENEFTDWWIENFASTISVDAKNIARVAWKAARNK